MSTRENGAIAGRNQDLLIFVLPVLITVPGIHLVLKEWTSRWIMTHLKAKSALQTVRPIFSTQTFLWASNGATSLKATGHDVTPSRHFNSLPHTQHQDSVINEGAVAEDQSPDFFYNLRGIIGPPGRHPRSNKPPGKRVLVGHPQTTVSVMTCLSSLLASCFFRSPCFWNILSSACCSLQPLRHTDNTARALGWYLQKSEHQFCHFLCNTSLAPRMWILS